MIAIVALAAFCTVFGALGLYEMGRLERPRVNVTINVYLVPPQLARGRV